jgi:hypothetical protein
MARVESGEIDTRAFHFETPFHCGTDEPARAHARAPGFTVNPAFRLGTRARDRRVRVLNDFIEFESGTSPALAPDRLEQDNEGGRRT